MLLRRLFKGCMALAGIALVAVAALMALQFFAAFPSPSEAAQRPHALHQANGEALWLEVDGARVEAWLLPTTSRAPTPIAIYGHGNGELIDHETARMDGLRGAGVAVLLVEFPGYGRSSGIPSERSILATFEAAYDLVAHDPRFDARRIVGYGRSLGGGAVAQLAAHRQLAALVLESTFTSVADIVRGYGVPDWLVLNRFDTVAVLRDYQGPVLILHGTEDVNIPPVHARLNRAAARNSVLYMSRCGHNDCPPHWEVVLSFLLRNGVFNESVSGATP
ncbi:MAG: alpha/beta hydrolase [Pseudomonadota bacterium]